MVTAAFPYIYFLNIMQFKFCISEICWDMKFLVLLMKISKRELSCILCSGILDPCIQTDWTSGNPIQWCAKPWKPTPRPSSHFVTLRNRFQVKFAKIPKELDSQRTDPNHIRWHHIAMLRPGPEPHCSILRRYCLNSSITEALQSHK